MRAGIVGGGLRELEMQGDSPIRSGSQMNRPAIKGLARATRGAYVRTLESRSLSRFVEHILFERAEVLSEGAIQNGKDTPRSYFGSTMITFDLNHLQKHWRGELDEKARAELCRLVEGSVRVRLMAARIACAEVRRRVTDRPLGTAVVETRVQLNGNTLQMDIDLEVPVGVFSGARRAT